MHSGNFLAIYFPGFIVFSSAFSYLLYSDLFIFNVSAFLKRGMLALNSLNFFMCTNTFPTPGGWVTVNVSQSSIDDISMPEKLFSLANSCYFPQITLRTQESLLLISLIFLRKGTLNITSSVSVFFLLLVDLLLFMFRHLPSLLPFSSLFPSLCSFAMFWICIPLDMVGY